jgi:hypothetical protein
MLAHPGVSLMVMASPEAAVAPQARPRVTIAGTARVCGPGDVDHEDARRAYLARFPQSEAMFGFGDFSLFVIEPRGARFVGGFAQATSAGAEALKGFLAGEIDG